MDKLDLLMWIISAGFSLLVGLMAFMWHGLQGYIKDVNDNLTKRIEKLDEKLTDVDRRVCRMEGSLTTKECCMLHVDHQAKKVE